MELKYGVKLTSLSPQMVLAAMVVKSVCEQFNVPCCITSANDSTHSAKSLHYRGMALDFRTKYAALNGSERNFQDTIVSRLGPDFDVVLEALGTDNEHLHVEYDPK